MKKMTKKEFKDETMKTIECLNDEELKKVSDGLHILYRKLKERGCIASRNLNELNEYLLDIEVYTGAETAYRSYTKRAKG